MTLVFQIFTMKEENIWIPWNKWKLIEIIIFDNCVMFGDLKANKSLSNTIGNVR
jgi:hypothetical protein